MQINRNQRAESRRFSALASVHLDKVAESLIEMCVIARRAKVSPTTVDLELATLRRLLRIAPERKEPPAAAMLQSRRNGTAELVFANRNAVRYRVT